MAREFDEFNASKKSGKFEVGGKFHSDNTNVLHLPDQKSFRTPDGRKADWPKTKTGRYKQTTQSSQYDTWRKNY